MVEEPGLQEDEFSNSARQSHPHETRAQRWRWIDQFWFFVKRKRMKADKRLAGVGRSIKIEKKIHFTWRLGNSDFSVWGYPLLSWHLRWGRRTHCLGLSHRSASEASPVLLQTGGATFSVSGDFPVQSLAVCQSCWEGGSRRSEDASMTTVLFGHTLMTILSEKYFSYNGFSIRCHWKCF